MAKYNLSGTLTAENLSKAFAGESQARNRYTFFSEVAKEEDLRVIEEVFLETADNERGHAEMFFDYLSENLSNGLSLNIDVPIGLGTTAINLANAAKGEKEEWTKLYPKFADDAKKEGFPEIYTSFSKIATVEARHEKRFLSYLERLEKNKLYKLPYEVVWECSNCGYRTKGNSAPDICPACHHPISYFKIACKEIYPIKK
ncbi:MAG: rubrerythrin family protein [Oscillospiraceae bacterium]|nr:rubrerythrin family protein [Oscillospiraceae bacterium]